MSKNPIPVFAMTLALGIAAACVMFSAGAALSQPAVSAVPPAGANVADAYVLGSGDKVHVTVYGEDDLSGDFNVDGSGNVTLPMLGQMPAGGKTLNQFSDAVAQALTAKNYLVNPRVSTEVTNYRPFSILGEVNRPGEYPYENGMTVLNAVALAGGYTYRADQRTVYVRRKGSPKEQELPADDRTTVFPGDTVRVDERIF